MPSKKTDTSVTRKELRSLEKRIERTEKKIADLKEFRRQIRDFLEDNS